NGLATVKQRLEDTQSALSSALEKAAHNYRLLRNERQKSRRAKLQEHRTRVISVMSSVDHTSKTQLDGWKTEISCLSSAFKSSPLAKRAGLTLDVNDFLRKVKGMHSDHANDQKKTYRLWQEWKHQVICSSYGTEKIERMKEDSPVELLVLLSKATSCLIEHIGGGDRWDAMDSLSRQPYITEMMEGLALTLGTKIYDSLPDEEKRSVNLFFWAGCSMHKELNSVKGGAAAMAQWWLESSITPPVLLANKDNAATLQLAEVIAGSDAAVKRAFEVSTRGGVKATSLAGAIFNHRDDKKGQQDIHCLFFLKYKGVLKRFPDTSNTRFHSHCDAARELIKYLTYYLEFLEHIRLNKENTQLNHMEENLMKALSDAATLTELAVLTLYSQAVTKSYMTLVRGPGMEGLNILDMGPLHEELKHHISSIIVNPDIVLLRDSQSHLVAVFRGHMWDDPQAIDAIWTMYEAGKLPHVKAALVAFLKGALATWEKFTSEFEAGGLIATSVAEERELAQMSTTNDCNEGLLGMWRKHSREKPSLTVGHFSDQAAFCRNGTQEFMNMMFMDEDHDHLRREARKVDASGVEKKRQAEMAEYGLMVAAKAQKKLEDQTRKKAEKADYFSNIQLIMDQAALESLLDPALKDQLELHRRLADEMKIPKISHLKSKKQRYRVLKVLIQRREARARGDIVDDVDFLTIATATGHEE
ncbi:hypothetical protein C8R48DRAFT_589777, partial [Suillus tomentosus]